MLCNLRRQNEELMTLLKTLYHNEKSLSFEHELNDFGCCRLEYHQPSPSCVARSAHALAVHRRLPFYNDRSKGILPRPEDMACRENQSVAS